MTRALGGRWGGALGGGRWGWSLPVARSRAKHAWIEELGAEAVFDSGDAGFADAVRAWAPGGVDAVIDNVGGSSVPACLAVLRPGGRLVAMGFVGGAEATIQLPPFFFAQQTIVGSLMGGVEELRWGLEKVADGTLSPRLDRAYPLAEAPAAHERLAAGEALGNLVLLPWEDA